MSFKESDYLCPSCKGHLNVDGNVVFATKTNRKHSGLILLSPKIGEYSYKTHPKFQLEKGELVEFYCPLCQADLTAEKQKEHAMIKMINNEDSAEYELYFSKKAGNKSTYVVATDIFEAFGEDAIDFTEFV